MRALDFFGGDDHREFIAGLYHKRAGDIRHPRLFRGVWNPRKWSLLV